MAGLGVTAILHSSTATGLMITGFAAGGVVNLVPVLALMLGANVGTALIVQVVSFDVSSVAPVLILIGFLIFRRASAGPRGVLIGLGSRCSMSCWRRGRPGRRIPVRGVRRRA